MRRGIVVLILMLCNIIYAQNKIVFQKDPSKNHVLTKVLSQDDADFFTYHIQTEDSLLQFNTTGTDTFLIIPIPRFADSSLTWWTAKNQFGESGPSKKMEVIFRDSESPENPQDYETYHITGQQLLTELRPGGTWKKEGTGTYQYWDTLNGLYLWRQLGPVTIYTDRYFDTSGVYTFTLRGFVWEGGTVHLVVDSDTTILDWHTKPQTVAYRIPVEAGTKRVKIIPINKPCLIEFYSDQKSGIPMAPTGYKLELVE